MPNRVIYFKADIYTRLPEIENLSGLINSMLEDYFQKKKDKVEVLKDLMLEEAKHKIEKEVKQLTDE